MEVIDGYFQENDQVVGLFRGEMNSLGKGQIEEARGQQGVRNTYLKAVIGESTQLSVWRRGKRAGEVNDIKGSGGKRHICRLRRRFPR